MHQDAVQASGLTPAGPGQALSGLLLVRASPMPSTDDDSTEDVLPGAVDALTVW